MRHLALALALALTIPILRRPAHAVAIWKGIFLTATLNSVVLIAIVALRLARYARLRPAIDLSVYVRNGGLLHHWMVYATVEVVVFAAMLEFWRVYPQRRRWLYPLLAANSLAIVLSLTRMLWLTCLVLLGVILVGRGIRWTWLTPILILCLGLVATPLVRHRIAESSQPDYYSNTERLQMLRVGLEMIRDHPLTGVGPGRVETRYRDYLKPSDSVPAFYGHLHNNLVQITAEFGLPVAAAAVIFVVALAKGLIKTYRCSTTADLRFLSRSAILSLAAFTIAGMFEYTYGHSLGLILLSFAVFSPLTCQEALRPVSLPLDGAGRLVSQVVEDGADPVHLHQLVGHAPQQVVGHTDHLGGHTVDGMDRAKHH